MKFLVIGVCLIAMPFLAYLAALHKVVTDKRCSVLVEEIEGGRRITQVCTVKDR